MLDIDIIRGFPIQNKPYKSTRVVNQVEMIGIIMQNRRLRECFPLFM